MAQRVFIPVFKQPYVLTEDATVLLYPFANQGEPPGIYNATMYAKYYKATGFTYKYNTRLLQYENDRTNEAYQMIHDSNYRRTHDERFDAKYDSYFVVTNTEFPQAVVDMMKSPDDLLKLGIGPVYIQTDMFRNSINDTYHVFVPTSIEDRFSRYQHYNTGGPVKPKWGKFLKELPSIPDGYIEAVQEKELRPWQDAQALGPQIDKVVERCIPIYYTFPAGSTFVITEGIRPYNKKYRVLEATINDVKYIITTSELHNFVLDELTVEPTTTKGKKK